MTVFQDESDACVVWQTYSVPELPWSISTWLSQNIDPTFDWVKAGMKHFSEHIVITLPPVPGKLPVAKHADAMATALTRAASAAKQARIAVDKACVGQSVYSDSIAYGFGLAVYGDMIAVDDALQRAQQQAATLCFYLTDVGIVVQRMMHLEAMRTKLSQVPSHVVSYNPSLMQSLRAVRAHSKLFSSQFWNLPNCK